MTQTYTISDDGKSITCLDCEMTSFSPNDVMFRYCGNCHEFHEFKELKARVHHYFDTTPAEQVVENVKRLRMNFDA